jgi:predicted nucleotidyltransferase
MVVEMVTRLVAEFHPLRVYLFGSYAWGNPSSDSDIDLLVVMDHLPDTSPRLARRAYRALRGRKAPVDILFRGLESFTSRAAHPSTLEHKIDRDGVLLHG